MIKNEFNIKIRLILLINNKKIGSLIFININVFIISFVLFDSIKKSIIILLNNNNNQVIQSDLLKELYELFQIENQEIKRLKIIKTLPTKISL